MSTFINPIGVPPAQSAFRGPLARIILTVFIVTSLLTALFVCTLILLGASVGTRDFISYWSAGTQLIHGANPYNASAVLAMERTTHGYAGARLIMRNPPSALFLVIPLGLVGVRAASILWSLLILLCLAVSIHTMWKMHGSPANRFDLLGYVFAPVLACLAIGQTSVFVLLGLVLFLRFNNSKPLLAGMALALCALKPHLFLPFAVALFAWMITRKTYRILAGAAIGMGICCVIPLFFDPSVWWQYAQSARVSGIESEFRPDPGTILRFAFDRSAMWIQFLPVLAACVWATWYFHRHRTDWDWQTHGSVLMLVSVFAAPYSWFFDQAVLLPALLQGLYSGKSLVALLALISISLIEMLCGVHLYSALFCWPAAAWLAWYLWPAAWRFHSNSAGSPERS